MSQVIDPKGRIKGDVLIALAIPSYVSEHVTTVPNQEYEILDILDDPWGDVIYVVRKHFAAHDPYREENPPTLHVPSDWFEKN